MGKFGRKLTRTRCHTGRIRYKTRGQAMAAMRAKFAEHGAKTKADFCTLCGAFHLAKEENK